MLNENAEAQPRMLGVGLVGEQPPDFVVGLDVGHGIRTRRLADGVLVDHLDRFEQLHVADDAVEVAGLDARVEEHAPQRRIEYSLGQRRFAAAADSRDAGHHAQRNPHVDIAQVVLAGAFYDDRTAPSAFRGGRGDRAAARQVIRRQAFFVFQKLRQRTAENHFAAVVTRLGTYVHDVVGGADHLFLVLDDDHRVAQIAQLPEHLDKPVRVARMQADRGFVEDVERAGEVAAQRGREVDALALAARQGR